VLARAAAGNLAAATALLSSRGDAGGAEGSAWRRTESHGRRRYDLASAEALLSAAGLVVEQTHGVRVVADLVPGAVADGDPEGLLAFELAAAARPPYRDIATQLHLFARRG
jgi:hypothetical protein